MVAVAAPVAPPRSKSPAFSRSKSPDPRLSVIAPQAQPMKAAALHPPAAQPSRNLVLQAGGVKQPGQSQGLSFNSAQLTMVQ